MTQDESNLNRRCFLAAASAMATASQVLPGRVAADGERYGDRQFVRARYVTQIKEGSPSNYLTGQSHDFPGHHFEPDSGKLFLNKFIRDVGKTRFKNNDKIVKIDRYHPFPSQDMQRRPDSFFTTTLGDGLLSRQIVFTAEPYKPPGVAIREDNKDVTISNSGGQVRLSPGERKKLPLPERSIKAIKNTDSGTDYNSVRVQPSIIVHNYGTWEVIDSNKAEYWTRTRVQN